MLKYQVEWKTEGYAFVAVNSPWNSKQEALDYATNTIAEDGGECRIREIEVSKE